MRSVLRKIVAFGAAYETARRLCPRDIIQYRNGAQIIERAAKARLTMEPRQKSLVDRGNEPRR